MSGRLHVGGRLPGTLVFTLFLDLRCPRRCNSHDNRAAKLRYKSGRISILVGRF